MTYAMSGISISYIKNMARDMGCLIPGPLGIEDFKDDSAGGFLIMYCRRSWRGYRRCFKCLFKDKCYCCNYDRFIERTL